MKNGVCLLQKKFVGVQPFIAAKKQNKSESKSKDAPRKTHSIRSNKNSVLKGDLIFAGEEGVPRGILKL
jgi:hypothetical protein